MQFLVNRFNEKYNQQNRITIRFFDEEPLTVRRIRYNQSGAVCYCMANQNDGRQKISNLWKPINCSEECKYRYAADENSKPMCNLEGTLKFLLPGISDDRIWLMKITGYKSIQRIQALSIHLEKPLENTENLWFSSNGKINGTTVKNWTSKTNITENTKTIVITDNLIMNNLIKATTDASIIAYSNLNNTYQVLKELDNTNIDNIIFAVKDLEQNEKLKNVIKEIYNDLIHIGYNIETKNIENYKDILEEDFLCTYGIKSVA